MVSRETFSTENDRASQVIAQGALTNSKRPSAYIPGVYPTHVSHGKGANLFTSDGRAYVDFIGGLGTNLFGYGHPQITDAASIAARRGPSLSLPSILEIEIAEKLSKLTGYPRVRFYKTGTEACMAALRIAKAVHRNAKVYSEGYHGWSDQFVQLTPPGAGTFKTDEIVPLFGDYTGGIVITEPVMLDDSWSRVDKLREYQEMASCVIYDEVITGFRFHKYFVYRHAGTDPDIVVLGKGLANGYPLAAVLMKKEYDIPDWFCSGTYCGELGALAAAGAAIDISTKSNVEDLMYYSKAFMRKLNDIIKPLEFQIQGYGTRGYLSMDEKNQWLFCQQMCQAGVLFGKAYFYGYAHMDSALVDMTLELAKQAVSDILGGRVVPLWKAEPVQSFKRY